MSSRGGQASEDVVSRTVYPPLRVAHRLLRQSDSFLPDTSFDSPGFKAALRSLPGPLLGGASDFYRDGLRQIRFLVASWLCTAKD